MEDQSLDGFETLDSGNVWGYGKIEIVRVDPLSGKLFGVATNSGGQRYPRRMKTFEE